MTGFLARRRAEDFNSLVEGSSANEACGARDAELIELVGALRGVPEATARPEFVADLRERLLAEADTALVPTDLSRLRLPARRPSRERRLAALAGGIAIVGATTSVAVASQSALPGDSLYPVKRALESAHVGLSVGEGGKGTTVLANASDRLDEIDALSREDAFGNDVRIADTLDTFTDQATEASELLQADYTNTGDATSIVTLRDFASSSIDQLEGIEPLVPADARDELIRAAAVLVQIEREASLLCPTCEGTPIDSVPPALMASETLPSSEPAAVAPSDAAGDQGTKPHSKGKSKDKDTDQVRGDQPSLPDLGQGLDPGSVLDPDGRDGDAGPTGGDSDRPNPLQQLTDGLTGGGSPSSSPSLPSVGDVVDGVGDILGGVIDPLTGRTPKR